MPAGARPRRALVIALVGTLLAVPPTASAQDSPEVKVVGGRVYMRAVPRESHTKVTQLVGYGITAGSRVNVSCSPRPACPLRSMSFSIDEAGIYRLPVKSVRIPVGSRIDLETRTATGYLQTLSYAPRRNRFSTFLENCADPQGVAIPCRGPCQAGSFVPQDRCQAGLGTSVGAKTEWLWFAFPLYTQFRRLTVSNVPAGATVAVFCEGKCPFGIRVRYFSQASRRWSLSGELRNRKLRPGSRLQVWILRGDAVGRVFRFSPRRGNRPRTEALCIYPAETTPRACPP